MDDLATGGGARPGDEDIGPGTWEWHGNELFDAQGVRLALVRSDVLYHGDERVLIEYSPRGRFRVRATTSTGAVYTIVQRGLSVQRLLGACEGRSYELDRTTLWRKERTISAGQKVVAVTRPRISGKMEIASAPGAGEQPLPVLDAIVLSWACVLVDTPVRNPRT